MPTFNDGESGASVRAKINTVIDKVDGVTAIGNDITITGDLTVDTTTLHVDSTNNRVGIGTVSPAAALDVAGDVRIGVNSKVYNDGGSLKLSADDNNTAAGSVVDIFIDGLEVADFNNAGYLRFNKGNFFGGGICTQSLDSSLQLAGGNNAINSGLNMDLSGPSDPAGVAGLLIRDNTTAIYNYVRSADAHLWYTGGSERVRINSSGNVGIGETAMDTPLHVTAGTTAGVYDVATFAGGFSGGTGSNGDEARIILTTNPTSGDLRGAWISAKNTSGGNQAHDLLFYTNAGASTPVENMRLTSSGNLGIGTSSPGSKLSIVGLPTSSAGLSSGDVWNDGGTLKIV